MERHRVIMKEFREQEFSRKLDIASKTRSRGYEDEIVKEEDLVFYQVEKKKAWLGPVKIFAIKGNSVFLFANGSMRKIPRCNVKLCKKREEESDFPHIHPLRRSQVVSQPGNCAGGNDKVLIILWWMTRYDLIAEPDPLRCRIYYNGKPRYRYVE